MVFGQNLTTQSNMLTVFPFQSQVNLLDQTVAYLAYILCIMSFSSFLGFDMYLLSISAIYNVATPQLVL